MARYGSRTEWRRHPTFLERYGARLEQSDLRHRAESALLAAEQNAEDAARAARKA